MTQEDLVKKLEKAKNNKLEYAQLLWQLNQETSLEAIKISLEVQIKDIIKEWDKSQLESNFKLRRENKIDSLNNKRLKIRDQEFSVKDYDLINEYLNRLGLNFFFFAGNCIISGYYSKIQKYDNVFFLNNALLSEPSKETPMLTINGINYVPKENFTKFVYNVSSHQFRNTYLKHPWEKYQKQFRQDVNERYGKISLNNLPVQLLFDYLDIFNAHEDGHINTNNRYKEYRNILKFDNTRMGMINQFLADSVDDVNKKSTLGFIKDTWKENPGKGKYYLGLDISYRLYLNPQSPEQDELLMQLIKIYNSDINSGHSKINNLQEKLLERLIPIIKEVHDYTINLSNDKTNDAINKLVPNRLLNSFNF